MALKDAGFELSLFGQELRRLTYPGWLLGNIISTPPHQDLHQRDEHITYHYESVTGS